MGGAGGTADERCYSALGYAGTLLVRSREELEEVRETGPLALLQRTAYAKADLDDQTKC
jgi:hypothetical protein